MKLILPLFFTVLIATTLLSPRLRSVPQFAPPAVVAPSMTPAPEPPPPPPEVAPEKEIRWSDIESSDPKTLQANLVAIGCPPATINDILHGRLSYDLRVRLNRCCHPLLKYWCTEEEFDASERPKQVLAQESTDLLASLGVVSPVEYVSRTVTDGFPAEHRDAIQRAATLFPRIVPASDASEKDWEDYFMNRRNRYDALKGVLTPEEFYLYRLEDGHAKLMAGFLEGLNLTEAEFSKVCFALDFSRPTMVNGRLAPDVEHQLRFGLGPERYAEYQEYHSVENSALNMFCSANGQSSETRGKLAAIRKQQLPPVEYQKAVSDVLGPALTYHYFQRVERP